MQLAKYTWDYIDKSAKWNWKLFLIAFAPFIPTTALFLINVVDPSTLASNAWINQVLFWIFVPILILSLFAAQKMDLVGSYGETILLLIPTFIWLLPGHVEAIKWMVIMSMSILIVTIILYSLITIFKIVPGKNKKIQKDLAHVFMRLVFVFSSVVSTLIISIILVDWADHSMKFWDWAVDDQGKEIIGEKDYTSVKWIVFIAVTTLIVATILVSLGLLSAFNNHFANQNKTSASQAIASKIKPQKKSVLERTRMIKIHKKRFWKRR